METLHHTEEFNRHSMDHRFQRSSQATRIDFETSGRSRLQIFEGKATSLRANNIRHEKAVRMPDRSVRFSRVQSGWVACLPLKRTSPHRVNVLLKATNGHWKNSCSK